MSYDTVSYFFAGQVGDSIESEIISHTEDDDISVADRFAFSVNAVKILFSSENVLSQHLSSPFPGSIDCLLQCLFDLKNKTTSRGLINFLCCQRFSASRSSSLKNISAVFSGHSLSETVFLFSLSLFWLISLLHD